MSELGIVTSLVACFVALMLFVVSVFVDRSEAIAMQALGFAFCLSALFANLRALWRQGRGRRGDSGYS